MKISYVAFAILFLFSAGVNAQTKTPEKGSAWIYDYQNVGSFGLISCTYERDSLIQGKVAIVMDATFYEPANPTSKDRTYIDNIILIEDSTVFYWNMGRFDTLHDFGAEVGDGWSYFYYSMGLDTTRIEVIEKGVSQDLGAYFIMQYETSNFSPEGNLELVRDTIYEKLLGGNNYIIPTDYMKTIIDGQEGGPLVCFSNKNGAYREGTWTKGGASCKQEIDQLGMVHIYPDKASLIYPNPSSGGLTISSHFSIDKIEVYNQNGTSVLEALSSNHLMLSRSGLYFVKLLTKSGEVINEKVLVH